MRIRARLAVVAVLALVAGIVAFAFNAGAVSEAPAIKITCIGGEKADLGQLRGRPVLVTFWSTDCPGCLREMPSLTRLYEDYSAQGLEIIGVAAPWSRPDQVLATVRAKGLPYRIGLDLDGSVTRAFGDVSWTPTSFLVDPAGRIRYQKVGDMDIEKVRRLVASMLARPAARQTALNKGDQHALD